MAVPILFPFSVPHVQVPVTCSTLNGLLVSLPDSTMSWKCDCHGCICMPSDQQMSWAAIGAQ